MTRYKEGDIIKVTKTHRSWMTTWESTLKEGTLLRIKYTSLLDSTFWVEDISHHGYALDKVYTQRTTEEEKAKFYLESL